MKLKLFFSLLITSLLFSSCLIKSFNPFYLKQNIEFDKQLVGTWMDQDSIIWNFEKIEIEKKVLGKKEIDHIKYKLNYHEDEGGISVFLVTLFKVDASYYLDFLPDYETISDHELFSMHTLPVHTLAKLEKIVEKDEYTVKWFNDEWLMELIKSGKSDIDHQKIYTDGEDDGTIVLTASSKKLQQFIAEFGDDPDAFDCDDKFSSDTFCQHLIRQ